MPITLVSTTSAGCTYEYGIEISAPRWKTWLHPCMEARTAGRSRRSPAMTSTWLSTSCGRAAQQARVAPGIVAHERPHPRPPLQSASTRWLAMNPPAPVTNTCLPSQLSCHRY